MPLNCGDPAPSFDGHDEQGHRHFLSGYRGQPVVLFFIAPEDAVDIHLARYLRAAREACFHGEVFALGVSRGTIDSLGRLRARERLPFPLMMDNDGRIAKAYGCWKDGETQNASVLIDADGVVRGVYKRASVPAHLLEQLRRVRPRA